MPRGRKKTKVELTQDDILALKSLVGLAKQLTEQNQGTQTSKNVKQAEKVVKRAKKKLKLEEDDGHALRPGKSKRLKERESGSHNYTKREPIKIVKNRENLFEKMDIFKKKEIEKDDIRWDKKWKKMKITPRGGRETLISMQCSGCDQTFDISPNEVKKDFDGKAKYVCNDCEKNRESSDDDYEELEPIEE